MTSLRCPVGGLVWVRSQFKMSAKQLPLYITLNAHIHSIMVYLFVLLTRSLIEEDGVSL